MRVGGAVQASTLPRWSAAATDYPPTKQSQNLVTYPYSAEANDRLVIWQGDISTLDVDVIACPTDETLLESNPVSDRVFCGAGPGLKEEILSNGLECECGEAVLTSGHSLPARRVAFTVLPRTSAHLTRCYRGVLEASEAVGAESAALPLLGTRGRGSVPHADLDAALRAVRGHLESHSRPSLVCLTARDAAAAAALLRRAHAYFPLHPSHSWQGGERRIRIIHNPSAHTTPEDDTSIYDDDAAVEAAATLALYDTQRLLPSPRRMADITPDLAEYERLLRRAQNEDLSEVSGIGCLYQSGVDRLGRPVVVFVGKWFPIGDIDLDKALLYLIKLLDPIVRGDYVIAYFHTLASAANHPPFSWLKEVYTVLPYKYKKNLKAFYIIHPTFWTRMATWWFTTFMAPAIKHKVHSLPGVEYLYSVMTRDQLEVPAFITEYDMTINGLHYFQPETTAT